MKKTSIDRVPMTFTCGKCGEKFSKTLGWLENNHAFACPSCSADIAVTGDQLLRFRKELSKIGRGIGGSRSLKIDL